MKSKYMSYIRNGIELNEQLYNPIQGLIVYFVGLNAELYSLNKPLEYYY
jgi:hypothetical protein